MKFSISIFLLYLVLCVFSWKPLQMPLSQIYSPTFFPRRFIVLAKNALVLFNYYTPVIMSISNFEMNRTDDLAYQFTSFRVKHLVSIQALNYYK